MCKSLISKIQFHKLYENETLTRNSIKGKKPMTLNHNIKRIRPPVNVSVNRHSRCYLKVYAR